MVLRPHRAGDRDSGRLHTPPTVQPPRLTMDYQSIAKIPAQSEKQTNKKKQELNKRKTRNKTKVKRLHLNKSYVLN